MKKITSLILGTLLLATTACCPNHTGKHGYRVVTARITYYWPGEDEFGSRVADPHTRRAVQGVTVAAHPDFKFGTHIDIAGLKMVLPSEHFLVQDRGRDVTRKKAAHGKAYVFDVFTKSRAVGKRWARTMPHTMQVRIYE
jgi:hypothetical protein